MIEGYTSGINGLRTSKIENKNWFKIPEGYNTKTKHITLPMIKNMYKIMKSIMWVYIKLFFDIINNDFIMLRKVYKRQINFGQKDYRIDIT